MAGSVLAEFGGKVKWVADLESFNGVFYCNEFWMPVRWSDHLER